MDKYYNEHRLDMDKIGDMPTVVERRSPDGTLMAIVFGANTAHLIMTLLNEHLEKMAGPEAWGEDK